MWFEGRIGILIFNHKSDYTPRGKADKGEKQPKGRQPNRQDYSAVLEIEKAARSNSL